MRLVTVGPLAFAVMLCALVVIARYADRVDRALSRIAIRLFGSTVDSVCGERPDRQAALRAARVPTTGRDYGSKTLLYAAIAAVAGSILGIYAIWGLLVLLSIDPDTLRAALPDPLGFLAAMGGLRPCRWSNSWSSSVVPRSRSGPWPAMPPTGSGGGIQGTSLMPAPDGSRQGYPRWSLLSTRSRAAWRSRWSSASSPISKTPTARPPRSFRLRSGAWTRSAPTSSPPSRRWGGARPARSSASSARTSSASSRAGRDSRRSSSDSIRTTARTPNPSRRALSICSGRWPKPMSRCWSRGRSF